MFIDHHVMVWNVNRNKRFDFYLPHKLIVCTTILNTCQYSMVKIRGSTSPCMLHHPPPLYYHMWHYIQGVPRNMTVERRLESRIFDLYTVNITGDIVNLVLNFIFAKLNQNLNAGTSYSLETCGFLNNIFADFRKIWRKLKF